MSRSNAPIVAEGLGKRYRLGTRDEQSDTLAGAIWSTLSAPAKSFRQLRRLTRFTDDEEDVVWALRDVDFEVAQGEVLGLIGTNGAGKSTLLKILTRITEPSAGRVWLRGRVASLLEVGTGFHPELSGRENVFLNGTLLGMSKPEVTRRFDNIVSFAEVEKFVDTPVKRYSSGMKVRLAFSVAAHLEAEILLVDEVLAVGDLAFQRKCLGKMRDVAGEGRTVVLVSHNMAAIRLLCQRVLHLSDGRIVADGDVEAVVDGYVAHSMRTDTAHLSGSTSLADIEHFTVEPKAAPVIKTGEPVSIRVTLRARKRLERPGLYAALLTLDQTRVAGLDLRDLLEPEPIEAGQRVEASFEIDALPLLPGPYLLEIYVKDMAGPTIERLDRWAPFDVAETAVYGRNRPTRWHGLVKLGARPNWRPLGAEPERDGSADRIESTTERAVSA